MNDLRMSVAIANNEIGNRELIWTIENTSTREFYVLLGRMGFASSSGKADPAVFTDISGDYGGVKSIGLASGIRNHRCHLTSL